MHNNAPKNEPFDWRYVIYVTAAFALVWTVGILVGEPADAAPPSVTERWTQPYGGCKEAWQAPRSEGAADCRAHGWVVTARLVVGPHGVVRYSTLPHCRNEDGSGQRSACSWNFHNGRDGNGVGVALWNDRHDRSHYVWPLNAPRMWQNWSWVDSGLADALAEGDAPHATTRNWARCMVAWGPTTVITCPDGYQEVS